MDAADQGDALHAARARRRGVRAALAALESACASSSGDLTWNKVLGERLVALGDAFDHHVAVTEGDDGLFEEILDAAPRLARRLGALRSDHVEIAGLIAAATAALPTATTENPDGVAAMRDAVTELMGRITRHRQLGADVVFEAYNVDIEAGD
jgi:hypothetical protein